MIQKIIRRPVFATVISMILILLGIVGILKLPITRFPEIAPPSVSVSAGYSGADAETVARSVLLPLEESINGVENMTYIRSKASSGSGTVNVFFKQGTDPNQAAVNVQTRASKALSDLPAEVTKDGVTVTPRQTGVIMTLNMYSINPDFDETFLQAYVNRQVIRELLRIDGVAQVARVGARNYAMRIWLNPNKMKGYGIVPNDVKTAIANQNFEIAPGQFGQNSDQAFETIIKYPGRFTTKEEFGNVIIKTNEDGSILHLKDVADIDLGPTNTQTDNQVDGYPGLTMNVTQNMGSNARDIDIAIRSKMKELSEKFPKGIQYNITYSVREQIDESISQVVHTLIEAFLLVAIVVFIFLQNIRATIIPAIAIPVSLIGTFFFMYILGYTINVLTLFALVLAIGIVVDDAIVVVEAITFKLEGSGMSPTKASEEAMREITPAILSITMVMAAVFLPIGFMEGPSGVFYRQFAYTLAAAILISALNALTLSPALCALILKKRKPRIAAPDEPDIPKLSRKARLKKSAKEKTNLFFDAFNTSLTTLTQRYVGSIKYLSKRKKIAIAGLAVVTAIGFALMYFTPTAFIPDEDDGFIVYSIKLPPSSSLARTNNVLKEALDILNKRKEIMIMSSSAGYNGVDGSNSTSYAVGYIKMYPNKERKGIRDISRFMDTVRNDLSQIKDASINVFQRPTIAGFGDQSGLQFVLEDRIGGTFQAFGQAADTFLNKLNQQPEILTANTSFEPNFPQYEMTVDREKAKVLGVDIKDMMDNFRQYFSRVRVSEFNLFDRQNRVYVQALPEFNATPQTLNSIYVRNKSGEMVPVSTLITLNKSFGPEIVTRYNLYNSIEINATPAKGFSSGQAMAAVKRVAEEVLPGNYQYEWTGISREEASSGGQTAFIILLSILFVYFLLAAQYESYLLPISVLLSILVGLLGVFAIINLIGLQNNIYVQVGLVMLIGLLAKNAILIVEYSEQHRRAGNSILQSALKGAEIRLRPILMTSFAFVAGLIPLMWTTGPSAQGNHSISFGTAGGMLAGVTLGIFIIPILFIIFQTLDERLKLRFKREE